MKLFLAILLLAIPAPLVLGQGVADCNGRIVVITVDGAGASTTLTENLATVYTEMGSRTPYPRPIIRPILWGTDDNLEDYRNCSYHRIGAAKLVCEVQRIRTTSPASPIVVIGYSAGSAIVMLAVDQLPPGAVDRIILLGPTISASRDVRPFLRASRCGVDVFYIPGDEFLSFVEDRWGAQYGLPGSLTVGTTGFIVGNPRCGPAADPLLCKLRQYDVSNRVRSHFNTVDYPFLGRVLVPMIGSPFCSPR